MPFFAPPVERLIEEFAKLPGIGHKTAQRLAFYVMNQPKAAAEAFAQASAGLTLFKGRGLVLRRLENRGRQAFGRWPNPPPCTATPKTNQRNPRCERCVFFCEGRQARFKTIVVFLFSKPFSGLIIRPLMSDMLRRSEMKSRSFSALCLEKKNCICKPYCSIMQNIKKMVNAAIE